MKLEHLTLLFFSKNATAIMKFVSLDGESRTTPEKQFIPFDCMSVYREAVLSWNRIILSFWLDLEIIQGFLLLYHPSPGIVEPDTVSFDTYK